ncbi:CLCN3 [Cordylochernes scorpioides]|uniref:CLCN3 n=1 Tax=Cordylochernes scorpioides TaxID=51811 RepID=A0ABY6KGZ0_9ARAC|nr:CLCN3 [Cordylochernes scorpioides]
MLEMTRTDPEWKDKIITGDETWVYDYDPETKRQYAEWRGQGEPRPKKSRILKSRNKVLLVAFLDNKGIVHHEYLPAGQTGIKEMYLDILRHLREAIRKKIPEKWPNGDWILHHNNARPHTEHLVNRCRLMDKLAVVYVRRVLMFFPHADNKKQRQG